MKSKTLKTPFDNSYVFSFIEMGTKYWNRRTFVLDSVCKITDYSNYEHENYITSTRPYQLFGNYYLEAPKTPIFSIGKKKNNFYAIWYMDGNFCPYIAKLVHFSAKDLFYSRTDVLLLNMGEIKEHPNGFRECVNTYRVL